MAQRIPDSVDKQGAEKVLDEFLKPYIDQESVNNFLDREETSLEQKAGLSYLLLNGDMSDKVENNVDYSDEPVYSDYVDVLKHASDIAVDLDFSGSEI